MRFLLLKRRSKTNLKLPQEQIHSDLYQTYDQIFDVIFSTFKPRIFIDEGRYFYNQNFFFKIRPLLNFVEQKNRK